MNKLRRQLICCSFIVMTGFSNISNVDARLPKYMAQRAAELLIEKSELQLKDPRDKQDFAANLVDFLYSTDKRQHLANWMGLINSSIMRKTTQRQTEKTKEYTEACRELVKLLKSDSLENGANTEENFKNEWITNKTFLRFAQTCFPCWTGTFTCFQMGEGKSAAYNIIRLVQALEYQDEHAASIAELPDKRSMFIEAWNKQLEEIKKIHNKSLSTIAQILNILLFLEIIDEWSYIESVYGNQDQYANCVPVPNTMYQICGKKWQGSCMVSTIHNLFNIFCRGRPDDIDRVVWNKAISVNDKIKTYLLGLYDVYSLPKQYYRIPGMTSPSMLKKFAERIFPDGISMVNVYEPTLMLFFTTLNNTLQKPINVDASVYQYITLVEQQAILDASKMKAIEDAFKNVFYSITGRETIKVTFKISEDRRKWATHMLTIEDSTIQKKVTIGLGKRHIGHHIEIIDIEDIPPTQRYRSSYSDQIGRRRRSAITSPKPPFRNSKRVQTTLKSLQKRL